MPPFFELRYFPGFGRAEIARALLAAGGADWRDDPVNPPDWFGTLADKQPLGRVPVLTERADGPDSTALEPIVESIPIERYIATTLGLRGNSPAEDAHIDALRLSMQSTWTAFSEYLYYGSFGRPNGSEEGLEAARKAAIEAANNLVKYHEQWIADHNPSAGAGAEAGHYVGSSLSHADIAITLVVIAYRAVDLAEPFTEDKAPRINAVVKTARKNPRLAEFFDKQMRIPNKPNIKGYSIGDKIEFKVGEQKKETAAAAKQDVNGAEKKEGKAAQVAAEPKADAAVVTAQAPEKRAAEEEDEAGASETAPSSVKKTPSKRRRKTIEPPSNPDGTPSKRVTRSQSRANLKTAGSSGNNEADE
ncbi:hypothetical protein GQ42DRAFT_164403 [Ramicandelaber brevisporus]|nr:hypothetical protein GQ42DRAFT_164403 [Ramicandelaber brevisporus]